MKFILIDRVTELALPERLTAVKAVSLAEEYLADHFPRFPVLPGVFMIEALVQAAAMLVHLTQNFAHSIVVLETVRNVKYKSFVKPGHLLELEVQARSIDTASSSFVGRGTVAGQVMVEGRFGLKHFNLADRSPELAPLDAKIKQEMQTRARLVGASQMD